MDAAGKSQYSYYKFGLWGKSSSELRKECIESEDMEFIVNCLEAIWDVHRHYPRESELDGMETLIGLFEYANGHWRDTPFPPSINHYFGDQYKRIEGGSFSERVQIAVICFIRKNYKYRPEVREKVDDFFVRHVPHTDSPLFPFFQKYSSWFADDRKSVEDLESSLRDAMWTEKQN